MRRALIDNEPIRRVRIHPSTTATRQTSNFGLSSPSDAISFGEADAILDELEVNFGVTVDDRKREWRTGSDGGGRGGGGGGDGRERGGYGGDGGGYGHDRGGGGGGYERGGRERGGGGGYTRAPDDDGTPVDTGAVSALIAERLECKKERLFDEARADLILAQP